MVVLELSILPAKGCAEKTHSSSSDEEPSQRIVNEWERSSAGIAGFPPRLHLIET
jgi:hypothetical protein